LRDGIAAKAAFFACNGKQLQSLHQFLATLSTAARYSGENHTEFFIEAHCHHRPLCSIHQQYGQDLITGHGMGLS